MKPTKREEHEIFRELADLCSTPGYAHVIANLCFRDNVIRFAGELTPDDAQHLYSRSRLIRTEMSTLIGLMVQHPIDLALPPPEIVREVTERTEQLLEELHDSLSGKMFSSVFDGAATDGETNSPFQGELLREPIFYGGESAYSFQYRDLAAPKYLQDDSWIRTNKGFSVGAAVKVVGAILGLQNDKQEAVLTELNASSRPGKTILPGFSFTIDEVAKRTGVERDVVGKVLEAFSLPAGDGNAGFTAIHDFNAVNATPLLRVGDQEFILFQYYSLVEALYESPFFWMAADKSYATTALEHRGGFTETFTFQRLQDVFGAAHVYRNATIEGKKGARRGEIDILVIFGDRAIVLQAKSKRLTIEARKGNDPKIKDDFKKAVQDAYDQAYECSTALLEEGCRLLDQKGNPIEIRGALKRIYPICVVADHYPALAFQTREFLKFRQTEAIASPLVSDVFAVDTMAEMLESPLRFLSYLDLRARFGEKLMAAHELTLLSYHLKHNLWFSSEHDFIILEEDIGVDLDVAMAVRREGIPGRKTPAGILTRFRDSDIGRVIAELERQSDAVAIELGLFLLTLREDTIDALNAAIGNFKKYPGKGSKHHDVTIVIGEASSGLTIHSNSLPDGAAEQKLLAHCKIRKYSQRANSWFGILLRPDDGSIRACGKLEHPWEPDDRMEELTRNWGKPRPVADVKAEFKAKRKVGRNSPCPCGSGRKYKKCCLT